MFIQTYKRYFEETRGVTASTTALKYHTNNNMSWDTRLPSTMKFSNQFNICKYKYNTGVGQRDAIVCIYLIIATVRHGDLALLPLVKEDSMLNKRKAAQVMLKIV